MLGNGEFDVQVGEDGIEVWVTQMGSMMNMNTAWIDRESGTVAIVDPFDSERWVKALATEGLHPTHLLYTHSHRDHTAGFPEMLRLVPDVEVWGHHEAIHKSFLGRFVFGNISLTDEWTHEANSTIEWSAGGINLSITHSPGHAPGHCTIHGHGVYHAGDLLFTASSGRVDLPGSDPTAQWKSILFARDLLRTLPSDWRLIPGHRYDWIDGSTPDWVSVSEVLAHNYALNARELDSF
ncbi:MAG TPA: MBL fold metallo-hydrolase [Candidatus Thalassarchaeaceae archaeon]|jgi:glyoxylase-like metal-dependent hydrolase (beta-lactamase superfamily II)|nr:MBL fold metallo-hydrolase [Candidatus Thalassarchaeaceae archaeon]MDP7658669.1 MBL fold metallo-hydrolase [Candidatus Thalassarchaeaceae archaeon]HJL65116.1 MBL fold metallo-hydrolase [Candidatus Thalassarchaeaceae archaeon]